MGKLKRRLRDQMRGGDLAPSQVSVLLRLERDGAATASSLARAEGMRPQSMAPVIAALEGAGLVRGAPDPTDGRQTLLSLTDACRTSVQRGTRRAPGLAVPHDPGAAVRAGTGRPRHGGRTAQAAGRGLTAFARPPDQPTLKPADISMALTTLDPNTALIVIDLQKGIVGVPLIHPIERGGGAGARAARRLPGRAGCPSSSSTSPAGAGPHGTAARHADLRPPSFTDFSPSSTSSRTTSS